MIISHNLYILWLEVNVCRLLYRWDINGIVRKCSPSANADGEFAGKENAFLIQNAFPIIAKYFDHIHIVENKPVTVHNELNRILTENLREVLALHNRGIHLIYTDIVRIKAIMEQELENLTH